jgi:hypothetical protein
VSSLFVHAPSEKKAQYKKELLSYAQGKPMYPVKTKWTLSPQ